jgi:hypothetical protein
MENRIGGCSPPYKPEQVPMSSQNALQGRFRRMESGHKKWVKEKEK